MRRRAIYLRELPHVRIETPSEVKNQIMKGNHMNKLFLGIAATCFMALSFIPAQTAPATGTGQTAPTTGQTGTTTAPATKPGASVQPNINSERMAPATSPSATEVPIRNSTQAVSPTPVASRSPVSPDARASITPVPTGTISPSPSPR
jgi:hypothetical protein